MPWHTRPPFAPAGALVFVAQVGISAPSTANLGGYWGLEK